MITIQKAQARGQADYGWLKANYSFSFAEYYNPKRMGFRSLRVLNEDFIAPSGCFPRHGHRDMEILTYVLEGTLEHTDSMGNRAEIRAGELQLMSAGQGVSHSEANPSPTEPLHLFQIWIEPSATGLAPRYFQREFPTLWDEWQLVVTPDTSVLKGVPGDTPTASGSDTGAFPIRQDVTVSTTTLHENAALSYTIPIGRHVYLHVTKGCIEVDSISLQAGDSLAISEQSRLDLTAITESEALLFDLA